jgi:hypothetical protein
MKKARLDFDDNRTALDSRVSLRREREREKEKEGGGCSEWR